MGGLKTHTEIGRHSEEDSAERNGNLVPNTATKEGEVLIGA